MIQLNHEQHHNQDAFGRFAERFARFMGTPKFIVYMTVFVIAWVSLNVVGLIGHWDPYPFILLNLFFSTQASYAAPLILLASNRQADRDKLQLEHDRQIFELLKSDTEIIVAQIESLKCRFDHTQSFSSENSPEKISRKSIGNPIGNCQENTKCSRICGSECKHGT